MLRIDQRRDHRLIGDHNAAGKVQIGQSQVRLVGGFLSGDVILGRFRGGHRCGCDLVGDR